MPLMPVSDNVNGTDGTEIRIPAGSMLHHSSMHASAGGQDYRTVMSGAARLRAWHSIATCSPGENAYVASKTRIQPSNPDPAGSKNRHAEHPGERQKHAFRVSTRVKETYTCIHTRTATIGTDVWCMVLLACPEARGTQRARPQAAGQGMRVCRCALLRSS